MLRAIVLYISVYFMVAIQIFASLLNANYVYTMSIYKIQDTMMMGADYYQTESEIASLLAEGKVPIGVGQNTKIKWVPSLSLTHIVQRKNNFHLLPHQGNHTCVFDIRIDFHKTMLNRSFTIFVFFFFEGIASLTRMPRLERMWSLQMLKWVYPICAQKSIDALGNFLATQNTISFLSTPICLLNALISQGVQEADRPNEGFYIRSGITVILKNATINDGTVI